MENINELVKYSVTDEALQGYRDEFLPLTITGIDDKDGYEKVREARLFVKGERVNVEKTRVRLKAESLEYGRGVDAEAKRITAAILEVEGYLEAEQKKIDDQLARIKFEKEQREKLPARIAALAEIGGEVSENELLLLDDNGFTELLNRKTAEKLEKQRAAQEERDRQQRAEQDRLDAEKRAVEEKRIEAERVERHKAELEEAKRKAAEDAKVQAEIDAKKKEDARIEAERAAKAEAERVEAERPDKEKLHLLATFLETGIPFPQVSSKRAQTTLARAKQKVVEIATELKAA